MNKLYNKDYREVKLKNEIDLVLVDIPYNLGKKAYASNLRWWNDGLVTNGKSEKANKNFFDTDENFDVKEMLIYIHQALKNEGKAVIFCSYMQQFEIVNNLGKMFKNYTPLVFIKNNSAEVLKSNMRIVGACEYGLVIYKEKLGTFNNEHKMVKNWFEMKKISKKCHPTQKPVELLEEFIKLYTNENDYVLDFCMGSGSTGIACKRLNRNFIGIEIEQNYYEIAQRRINEE